MTLNNPEKLLSQAEELCQQRNVRLTPQRLEVLRLMAQQPGAISAYDLLDLLRVSEPQAKPPTVYRALDFLLEQGFIHRVESANSYVLCHHFEEPSHTSALFICDRCGLVTEKPQTALKNVWRNWHLNLVLSCVIRSLKRMAYVPNAKLLKPATATIIANTTTALW